MMQCWAAEPAFRPTTDEILELLEANQELIVPCISVPHENVSIDGLSGGTFSPGLSSRCHSFRSSDLDFNSEASSIGIKSKFGSLRKALQNSLTKKRMKTNGANHKISPGLVRREDLGWTNDLFTRQGQSRCSNVSDFSLSSVVMKMNPVITESTKSGQQIVELPKCHIVDERFKSLAKKQESSTKARSDSAPLIPKERKNSLRKMRSHSIGNKTNYYHLQKSEHSSKTATLSSNH